MAKPFVKGVDPINIFMQGQKFQFAAFDLLKEKPNQDVVTYVMLLPPAMVLSAFSVEIYLKCLHCLDTGRAPTGHDLFNLFQGLSQTRRDRIEFLWIERSLATLDHQKKLDAAITAATGETPPSRDLIPALKAGRDTFAKLRYSYEGGLDDSSYVLTDLPVILRHVIIEIRPSWAQARPVVNDWSPTPPPSPTP